MTDKQAHDITGMSFEQAMGELEQIVKRLENGQGELENAIADYTRGTELKKHCQDKLKGARLRVEQISRQADGSLTTQPFDQQ